MEKIVVAHGQLARTEQQSEVVEDLASAGVAVFG